MAIAISCVKVCLLRTNNVVDLLLGGTAMLPIKRTNLERFDVPEANYKTVIMLVEVPPQVNTGLHTHPGFDDAYPIEGDLTVLVPTDSTDQVGLRACVSKTEARKILKTLTEDESSVAANWSRRFKNNLEKLHSGDPYEVAEVLRNLAIRDREKGLSAGEKRMITKARQILISELAFATGKSEADAEIVLDGVLDDAHGAKIVAAEA